MNLYYGLTPIGVIHTIISIIAVVVGVVSFFKYKEITTKTNLGKWYVGTTVIVCLTGFGIFQHGGFGKAHMLGILTLLVIALALAADRLDWFGRLNKYVVTLCYSVTFFFHMVPAVTEGSTRLPYGHPLLASAEAPQLAIASGVLLLVLVVGCLMQVLRMRKINSVQPSLTS